MPRVIHHDIDLRLLPDLGRLEATDALTIAGDDGPLCLHINARLTLAEVRQDGRPLCATCEWEEKLVRRYRIDGWAANAGPLTIQWSGCLDRFEGYRVTVVRPGCVELSGFGNWFPTVESQSQLEQFTYDLRLALPPGWQVVTPGITAHRDTLRMVHKWERPTEDILICAAPAWQRQQVESGAARLMIFASGFSDVDLQRLGADFRDSVAVAERRFGPMMTGCGGAFVITPRGPEAADWGYERGDIWVVGDEQVRALLANDWCMSWLPGPMSLALHETLHAWFGQALRFREPWLAEAITQYLQVVLGEEMFGRTGLAADYFEWYRGRIAAQPAKVDRPISSLTIADDMYVGWYLKGSWAFWDLEALTGREPLLDALAAGYRRYVGTEVDATAFIDAIGDALAQPVRTHFAHWFDEIGFAPVHRP